MHKKYAMLLIAITVFQTSNLLAKDLTLSIQPVLLKSETLKAYRPLAEYLSKVTGNNIKIKAYKNFITYWADMRINNGFDLVLDAAHFTDYRVQKKEYDVLAKLSGTVSFSIVTHEDNLIFDADELILQKVATMSSPGIGAIRLLQFFTNPMKQPKIVYVNNSSDAANMVTNKKVVAAIIPTALVSRYEGLNTVLTTQSIPHMAFSASPDVSDEIKSQIKSALIKAKDTTQGQAMLQKLNFTSFEKSSAETYKGFSLLLKNVFGY